MMFFLLTLAFPYSGMKSVRLTSFMESGCPYQISDDRYRINGIVTIERSVEMTTVSTAYG